MLPAPRGTQTGSSITCRRATRPLVDRAEAPFIINNAMVPVVVALQADGRLPFPLLNETDPAGDDRAESTDRPVGGKPAGPAAGKADARGKSADAPPAAIRVEGLMRRTAEVPVPPADSPGCAPSRASCTSSAWRTAA